MINVEYITTASHDKEIWAECWISEQENSLQAQCYIFGPGRGIEIFSLVQETLQQKSNFSSLPLKHVFTASHKGAVSLIEKVSSYTSNGMDLLGNNLFERVYHPIE